MKIDKPSQPPSPPDVSDATGQGREWPAQPKPDPGLRERKSHGNPPNTAKKISKIEAIKAALAKGNFSVDDEVVADTLFGHTKKALRKSPRMN